MKSRFAISRREFLGKARGLISLAAFSVAWPRMAKSQKTVPRDRYSEILYEVKTHLERLGVKEVTGVGPLKDDSCLVLVQGDAGGKIPEDVELKLFDQSMVKIKLIVQQAVAPAQLFTSFTPPPQHSGPLMGGDPVYNNEGSWWGTIAFTAPAGSLIKIEGESCASRGISCNHVMYNPSGNIISTTNFPNCMTLAWHKAPSATHWVDVAGADITASTPVTPLQVRGLETIKAARQPTDGIRVLKYGATTGLTSGKDLGRAWRIIDPMLPNQYYVRLVSGLFSEKGDSGAAVLDAERNFVGMVFAGVPNTPDEKYYMHALPKGETPPDPDLSCITIESMI